MRFLCLVLAHVRVVLVIVSPPLRSVLANTLTDQTSRTFAKHTAFLHKKSWHTAGMAVVEDVWKREQQAEHEKRRLEEMKREIEDERKQNELKQEAIAAGHVVEKVERLEFMYKGRVGEAAPAAMDEKLIGKKRFDLPVEEGHNLQQQAEEQQDEAQAKNEAWNKLNADPLLVMKQRELSAKQYVTNNPVRMAQLKEESRRDRDRKRAKKDAKREERREKKRAIKREVREKYGRKYDSSSESRSRSRSPRRRRRSRSPRRRSRSLSPRRDRRRGDDDRDRRMRRDSREPRREDRHDGDRKRRHDEIKRDDAHAQDASKGYGLTYAHGRAEDAAAIRRDKRSRWREEEAKRVSEREPEPEWRGGNNVGHRTGKISAEEKAARLASMMNDASAHDEARIAKLRKNVGELGGEMSFVEEAARGPSRHHNDAPSFIAEARSSAYGEPSSRRR